VIDDLTPEAFARDELLDLQRDLDAGRVVAGSADHRARLAVVAALEAPAPPAPSALVAEPSIAAVALPPPTALPEASHPVNPPRRPMARSRLARFRIAWPSRHEGVAAFIVSMLVAALLIVAGGEDRDVSEEAPRPGATGVPSGIECGRADDSDESWGAVTVDASGPSVSIRWNTAIGDLDDNPPFTVVGFDATGAAHVLLTWDGEATSTPPDADVRLFEGGLTVTGLPGSPLTQAAICT
jgi:hypothetical protein